MKDQTCCFTGHRDIPASEYAAINHRLDAEIENLIHQGVRYFGAGGALGFDTMAAFAVVRMKIKYPHIRLILVLPCKNQTRGWEKVNKKIYNIILREADKVVYLSKRYSYGCMQKRNRHLVEGSAVCICYLTEPKGGTAYTVQYAEKKGLQVIHIAPPPAHIPPPPP